MAYKITDACIACGACADACPVSAISEGDGKYEITLYTSCCNADTGVYYYTTYDNNQITAVSMHHEDLEGVALVHYPIIQKQNIFCQN